MEMIAKWQVDMECNRVDITAIKSLIAKAITPATFRNARRFYKSRCNFRACF